MKQRSQVREVTIDFIAAFILQSLVMAWVFRFHDLWQNAEISFGSALVYIVFKWAWKATSRLLKGRTEGQ
jgi:hypothetical protein